MVIYQSYSSPTGYPQQGYGSYQEQGYVMHPQQPQAQYPTDHQYYGYNTNQYAPPMAPNPYISTILPPHQHSNHHMMVNGSSGYNQQQEGGWCDKINKYQTGTPPGYRERQSSYGGDGSGGGGGSSGGGSGGGSGKPGKVNPTAYGGYEYGYEYSWGTQPYQTYGHNPGQDYQNVYYSIKKVD